MELEVGKQYAVSWVDDSRVILCKYVGVERGFHVFKDAEGQIIPVRESHLIVRKVYDSVEAVGRGYGDTCTITL